MAFSLFSLPLGRCTTVCALALGTFFSVSLPVPAYSTPDDLPWQWPTGEPRQIVEDFAPPAFRWLAGNRGVVLDAAIDEVVVAPASGVVSVAGRIVDRDVVVIVHDERRSTFEPVTPLVSVGQAVHAGEPIGVVSTGPNGPLHWGVKTGPSSYLNPLRQLAGDLVLKPWDGLADK